MVTIASEDNGSKRFRDDDVKPAPAASVRFTYDDFLNRPDDGRAARNIDGEPYVTPSPNTKHQTVAVNLTAALRTHLQQHPIGAVFVAPFVAELTAQAGDEITTPILPGLSIKLGDMFAPPL